MTSRTRLLATGALAAVLLLAPVACSDDDGGDAGNDNGNGTEQTDETTTTEGDGEGEEVPGPDDGTADPIDDTTPGLPVETPPEAQALCDKLDDMSDLEVETLEEVRGAFAELGDVVPEEAQDAYQAMMEKLNSASTEEEIQEDPEAEMLFMEFFDYASENCQL